MSDTKDILRIEITLDPEDLRDPERGPNEVSNAVYALLIKIFESGGEYNRFPDGSPLLACHGHHRAQEVTKTVLAEWLEARERSREMQAAKAKREKAGDLAGLVNARVATMQAAGLCPRGGEIVDYTIGLCSCMECPTPRPGWVAR